MTSTLLINKIGGYSLLTFVLSWSYYEMARRERERENASGVPTSTLVSSRASWGRQKPFLFSQVLGRYGYSSSGGDKITTMDLLSRVG